MNVLFLNSIGADVWGGGEKWMLVAATGLQARGHVVSFCGRPASVLLQRSAEAGLATHPLAIRGDFGPGTLLRLRRILRRTAAHVVIANFNKDVRLAGLAARFGTGAVVLARNGLPILPDNWRYRLTYRRLVSGIITNTVAIKNQYLAYGWLTDDFISVIHNGIDSSQPVHFPRREVLGHFDLPDGRPLVGLFGRLVGQKQPTRFLDVADGVLGVQPDALFLVVGDGPLRTQTEEHARRLGIDGSVRFLGFQRDVLPLCSICDLVLLTSLKEGLPNAVQEAMLAGRAVVAFDVGGVRELIPDHRFGRVVPLDDVRAMTSETIALLQSSALRAEIGARARARISEEFALDVMIDRLEELLPLKLRQRSA